MSAEGRQIGKQKKLATYEDKRIALDLYRNGLNMQQIANRFGMTRQGVWSFLKSRGVLTRPRHAPSPFDGTGEARWERDDAGITVTLRRQDTRELHSMHVHGKRLEALRHLADLIDRSGVDWRVLSYSTPETIRGDLAQKRVVTPGGHKKSNPAYLNPVEAHALSRIGRLDLLDPAIDLAERGPRPKR